MSALLDDAARVRETWLAVAAEMDREAEVHDRIAAARRRTAAEYRDLAAPPPDPKPERKDG